MSAGVDVYVADGVTSVVMRPAVKKRLGEWPQVNGLTSEGKPRAANAEFESREDGSGVWKLSGTPPGLELFHGAEKERKVLRFWNREILR